MLVSNSPTLQRMIASVKPGDGNMYTAPVYSPGQFQQPYLTPKDMVMQSAAMYQPYMGYGMGGFQVPNNTIAMINGVPTELGFNNYPPQNQLVQTTYREVPGAPVNPDLAHLTGKTEVAQPAPGRYMSVGSSSIPYGQVRTNSVLSQPTIVGAYNPYPNINQGYNIRPNVHVRLTEPPPRRNQTIEVTGAVDMYNGQMIHPHVNSTWYGSEEFPFVQNSVKKLQENEYQESMRDKFNQKFPGYMSGMGIPQINRTIIPREILDMANVAAFYGMTYNDFIKNGSEMYKRMSRHANRFLGRSEDEIEKREKLYDLKYKKLGADPKIPEDDKELFYPSGAFDYNGKLTREYQTMFCVCKRRMDALKDLQVYVVYEDGKVECPRKRVDILRTRENIDRCIAGYYNNENMKRMLQYRSAQQYMAAPEREIDHIDGNAFQVTARALAFADQKELEAKLLYQNRVRSSSMFNHDLYISTIKGIRDANKENKKAAEQKKWNEFIHRVVKNGEAARKDAPTYKDRPYICDGDWMIAKPGVDVFGLPLDQSVSKIVRFNTATGEEEIYDPGKMIGLDVRERIKESLNPSFNEIDDEEELSKRLDRFCNSEFRDF